MPIKLKHSVITSIGVVVSGILLGGAFLDAISNSLSLISKRATYILTAVVIIAACAAHLWLKKRPLTIIKDNGEPDLYRGLDLKVVGALIGIVIILWIPRLFDTTTPDSPGPRPTPTPLSKTDIEGSLQKKLSPWVDRVFISQAENGGIKIDALDPSSPTQIWVTAQCLKGVFASRINIDRYAPQIKSAFDYIEKGRRRVPEEGWGLFEEREKTLTEIAGWVILAYVESIESKTLIWNDDEMTDVLSHIQRDLDQIIQRQSADGGWRPIQDDYPGFTRTYSTIMALWSLVEARRSPAIYKVIGNRYDTYIRRGIMWLLARYDERLGWVPNPNRGQQDERFDGLTAQALFVLSRAEKDFGFLETENIYVKAEKNFATHKKLPARDILSNDRTPDIDASNFRPSTYQAENTTFLWFPWSFLELTHLSTDTSLSPDEQQSAAQLRFKLLESGAEQLVIFVEKNPIYNLGEVLFCLSISLRQGSH
jgi:hypothetical protein